jgi:hypothetical protein
MIVMMIAITPSENASTRVTPPWPSVSSFMIIPFRPVVQARTDGDVKGQSRPCPHAKPNEILTRP